MNLWYDFLEPRNQDVHNVMTQVTELFKCQMLAILEINDVDFLGGIGEKLSWKYGIPKVSLKTRARKEQKMFMSCGIL